MNHLTNMIGSRPENTIFLRKSSRGWDAFGKSKGEGFIISTLTKEDTILFASRMLWAIECFGRDYQEGMASLDEKDYPEVVGDYPIVDETKP